MAAASRRSINIVYSGDVEGDQAIEADGNATSPASVQLVTLPGLNDGSEVPTQIIVPDGATAVTIVKPGDNTSVIVLTGMDNGDVASIGLKLHPTDPDSVSLALDTDRAFWLTALTATSDVTVRLFWS